MNLRINTRLLLATLLLLSGPCAHAKVEMTAAASESVFSADAPLPASLATIHLLGQPDEPSYADPFKSLADPVPNQIINCQSTHCEKYREAALSDSSIGGKAFPVAQQLPQPSPESRGQHSASKNESVSLLDALLALLFAPALLAYQLRRKQKALREVCMLTADLGGQRSLVY